MSQERLLRIARILRVRERLVEQLEVEVARLARLCIDAANLERMALEGWTSALEVRPNDRWSCADFDQAHSYAATLGLRYEARVREARQADLRCAEGRARLHAARTEVRKIEILRDRISASHVHDERALERRATDEMAARRGRTA